MHRRIPTALAAAVLAAACSPADADDAVAPPVVETTDTLAATTTETAITTTATTEATSPPTATETSDPDVPVTSAAPATTEAPSSTAAVEAGDDTATDDTAADDTAAGADPVSGAGGGEDAADDTEDPSFVLGPDVVLDVDVARFPVDDAGIGGTPDSGAAEGDVEALPATGWAGVDAFLESVLIRPGNTAASVAVSIDGEVVHSAVFGVRDPATGDVAEPQDRFRIASISKPITAITVMALVEDGVIGLDDPLGDAVARHVGLDGANGASAQLTLRQLLTHRSGFGKYDRTFFRGAAADCIDAARTGLTSGVGGGGYVYSNMNYCVAGLAIEAVTGLTYEQAVYRHLLTPLGITGMRLAPTIDPGPDEIQHVTTPGRNYMETLGAAGAWIATPSDLVTIFDSLDVDSGGFKPLSVETVLQMLIPPGGTLGQRGYGLGVISYGDNRYGHTGTIESTHAMVLNRGDGVIWSITVAGQYPGESTALERIMNDAFAAGGFVAG